MTGLDLRLNFKESDSRKSLIFYTGGKYSDWPAIDSSVYY